MMKTVQPSLIIQQDTSFGRILLVEGDPTMRLLLSNYLIYRGYQVQCLAGGADLFQALVDWQPHLISLELNLADIDGYTLLAQLQQHPNWRHIPVIVVSAYALRADIQRARRLGAKRYLVKPMNVDDLTQAIHQQLSKSSAVA